MVPRDGSGPTSPAAWGVAVDGVVWCAAHAATACTTLDLIVVQGDWSPSSLVPPHARPVCEQHDCPAIARGARWWWQ
eukprot:3781991-Alexandrium_andersonii.AAC.1